MNPKKTLRLISLVMLMVAVIFLFCAVSCPTLGRTIYIGSWAFGAKQWRACYKLYAAVMVSLFAVSFFVSRPDS